MPLIEWVFRRSIDFFFSFAESCLIGPDASKYFYVAQGMLTIDGIDDTEEMKLTDEAMDVLGFTPVSVLISSTLSKLSAVF